MGRQADGKTDGWKDKTDGKRSRVHKQMDNVIDRQVRKQTTIGQNDRMIE